MTPIVTGSTESIYVPLLTPRQKFKYAPCIIGVDFIGEPVHGKLILVGVDFVRVDLMGGH